MRSACVCVGVDNKPKGQRPLSQPGRPTIYASRSQYLHRFRYLDSANQDDYEYTTAAETEKEFVRHLCAEFTVSALPLIQEPLTLARRLADTRALIIA